MFWGLSSAVDLYDEYLKAHKLEENVKDHNGSGPADCEAGGDAIGNILKPQNLNVLILGAGDPRHVIKTLSKRYTHNAMPFLNIYTIDGCIEITARNMLLLGIAMEPPGTFSLISKVHLFMDIYGNTLIRPTSNHFMAAKARVLLKIITDNDELQKLVPIFNIDLLKYTERDGLENAFNFWQPKPQNIYNIEEYWSNRVRALLGSRYDYREGAFDWDLSMVLKDRETQQICSQEYRYWRECGIAFTYPEYEYCKPNKTFAAGLVRNGQSFLHRGYAGDIKTGPFCAFGLRTTEERMHNSQHGENDYRATDITERNLLELFYELEHQKAYVHDKELSRKYGSVKLLMGKRLQCNETDIDVQQLYDKPWLDVPRTKLHFVTATDALEIQKDTSRWSNFFDIIFVGYNLFPLISAQFSRNLRENGLLILETKLLTVERQEYLNEFETKLMNFAKDAQLTPVINYQAINGKNMCLKFKKIKKR